MIEKILDLWIIKLLISILLTLFGPWNGAYQALLIVMLVDFVTGIWAAVKHRRLSSSVARQKTVAKLMAYSITLLGVSQLEAIIKLYPVAIGSGYTLYTAILYLATTEVISILENIEKITGFRLKPFTPARDILEGLSEELPNGQPKREGSKADQ